MEERKGEMRDGKTKRQTVGRGEENGALCRQYTIMRFSNKMIKID